MTLALAGQFCKVIGSSYSQINSRVSCSFHMVLVQPGAICIYGNENLKRLKLSLQIFGLNMAEFKYICM